MLTVAITLDPDTARAEFVDDRGAPFRLWLEPGADGWAVVATDGPISTHPTRLTAVMAWTAAIGGLIDDHAERLEGG